MNILAMADLHGRIPKIPPAIKGSPIDLLVLAGDITPNFNENWTYNDYFQRMVNVKAEAADQRTWAQTKLMEFREKVGATQMLFINGNHDFFDSAGVGEYHLFQGAKTVMIEGIKVGMLAGSGILVNEWNDEIDEKEFRLRIRQIDPDIQLLISHMPPHGILDTTRHGDKIGSTELTKAIFGNIGTQPYFTHLKHHIFGHCHESRGTTTNDIDGRSVVFHNVAERYEAITL